MDREEDELVSEGSTSVNDLALRVGLIGHPVAHSLSPRMQQAAFDALGIPVRYELWDARAEELPARIAMLREPGALGANITIPYKAAVVSLLDEIDPQSARSAGVVNTIVRVQSEAGVRLIGHNTDILALQRILGEQAAWHTRRVLVLGAGGAAQAALGAARVMGAEVWVAARDREKAAGALAALWLRERDGAVGESGHAQPLPDAWRDRALALGDTRQLGDALAQVDVLVQATSVGMQLHDDPQTAARSPVPLELLDQLPASALVVDVIYAPRETVLVHSARQRGLRATGGLPMLLYQGAAAFELWTGEPAPLIAMQAALGL